MKKRAVILLTNDRNIFLIYRKKNGREYYVFPGGGVEEGESVEEAVLRELKEEASVDASLMVPLCVYKNIDRLEYFFHVLHPGGELKLGGPEKDRQSEDNVYRLEWVPFEKVKDLPLQPEGIKDWVLENLLK